MAWQHKGLGVSHGQSRIRWHNVPRRQEVRERRKNHKLEIRTHDPAGIVGIHKKNGPHLSDGVERMGYGSLYPVRTQGARVVLELKRSRFLLEETRKEKLERLKMPQKMILNPVGCKRQHRREQQQHRLQTTASQSGEKPVVG